MIKKFTNSRFYKTVKRLALPVGLGTVGIAAYQGWKLRDKYLKDGKLEPPTGPTSGLEEWIDKARSKKDELLNSLKSEDNPIARGVHKVKDVWEEFEMLRHGVNKVSNVSEGAECWKNNGTTVKKVRLIVIGDSLVAGVGNDDPLASPALPHMIATMLSKAVQSDVAWISVGIVGGTVVDLREKALPQVREKLEKFRMEENVHNVVVITCGLNDWKSVFINFPSGLWPFKFRNKLRLLVADVHRLCTETGNSCQIFLPNLPLVCIKSDPEYIMNVKPLGYFVDALSYIWDVQKDRVASRRGPDKVRHSDSSAAED